MRPVIKEDCALSARVRIAYAISRGPPTLRHAVRLANFQILSSLDSHGSDADPSVCGPSGPGSHHQGSGRWQPGLMLGQRTTAVAVGDFAHQSQDHGLMDRSGRSTNPIRPHRTPGAYPESGLGRTVAHGLKNSWHFPAGRSYLRNTYRRSA